MNYKTKTLSGLDTEPRGFRFPLW